MILFQLCYIFYTGIIPACPVNDFISVTDQIMLMAKRKNVVIALLTHWSYRSLALNHHCDLQQFTIQASAPMSLCSQLYPAAVGIFNHLQLPMFFYHLQLLMFFFTTYSWCFFTTLSQFLLLIAPLQWLSTRLVLTHSSYCSLVPSHRLVLTLTNLHKLHHCNISANQWRHYTCNVFSLVGTLLSQVEKGPQLNKHCSLHGRMTSPTHTYGRC